MKQGGRPEGAIRTGKASGRVLKGNGCEYVSLTDIKTKGTSCTNGKLFLFLFSYMNVDYINKYR